MFNIFYIIFSPITQAINVITLNNITTWFSLQPDSSKWWWSGAILNTLFPVFLNTATWIITDNVSSTGIIAIINNNRGIFKYNAIPDTTPPRNSEPVSPINAFAGYILNIKNPNVAPITIAPNTIISFVPNIVAIIVKHVIIIVLTLDDNPSIPSVKFIAFVVASITKIANGIYNHIGIVTYLLANGIYVSVLLF